MGVSENSDDHTHTIFKEIAENLNLDPNTQNVAWDNLSSIRQIYVLPGPVEHWIACSIYMNSMKAKNPTVGQTELYVKGNCINLNALLRLCDLSLMQFFTICKNWCDMANMPAELRKKTNHLERKFAVNFCIFKKYLTIFNSMFQNPIDDQTRQPRSRKPRNVLCTPSRVFDFCWTLFVYVKGEFTESSADLVTSFHLLLACCDMAFNNALIADRRDLLNKDFPALPQNFNSPDYVKPTSPVCIIDVLCREFNGVVQDAKWVKEYSWKRHIAKLFANGVLHGDESNFTGLFDPQNFDINFKAINKRYEEHVLNIGEFDEKIFLAQYRRIQLIARQAANNGYMRSPINDLNSDNLSAAFLGEQQNERNNLEFDNRMNQLVPQTPLTGRRYGSSSEQNKLHPVTQATQCVIRLQNMLISRQPEPSAELLAILKSCSVDPTEYIKKIIDEMSILFRTAYTKSTSDQSSASADLADVRIRLAKTLYYKLLENIYNDELEKPNLDLTTLSQNNTFHQVLFACSIEIVIYSYNSYNTERKFPWILKALDIKPINFYKVIELIVRTKDQLSRDVIKHLKTIEEQILDSLAWTSDSPLWQYFAESKEPVPCYEDICLPGQTEDGQQMINHNIKKIQIPTTANGQQSPVYSATERFQSPIPSNSLVKKKLFLDSSTKIKPGQSLLQNKVLVVVDEKGNQKIVPINDVSQDISVPQPGSSEQANQNTTPAKPKRQGSLALFLRKFYALAGIRMRDLCENLGVTDTSLMQKIFTCFEHSIMENTDLMKDRHLDQLLMCAIYVICKVSRNDKSFTDIMCCYRFQPQADSHIYRSVLISKISLDGSQAALQERNSSEPVDPSELAGSSMSHEKEIRGDLIYFYNKVYVQRERQFVSRFSNQVEDLHLSPLPTVRNVLQTSPKRRVTNNVFVKPFDHTTNTQTNVKQYSYLFSRSPSKDLQNINQQINSRVGKRLLTDDDDEDIHPLKKPMSNMSRKLQGLIEERLGQTTKE